MAIVRAGKDYVMCKVTDSQTDHFYAQFNILMKIKTEKNLLHQLINEDLPPLEATVHMY